MSLVKRDSYSPSKTSVKSEAGNLALIAGGSGMGLLALAAVLPGGVLALCVLFLLAGIILKVS